MTTIVTVQNRMTSTISTIDSCQFSSKRERQQDQQGHVRRQLLAEEGEPDGEHRSRPRPASPSSSGRNAPHHGRTAAGRARGRNSGSSPAGGCGGPCARRVRRWRCWRRWRSWRSATQNADQGRSLPDSTIRPVEWSPRRRAGRSRGRTTPGSRNCNPASTTLATPRMSGQPLVAAPTWTGHGHRRGGCACGVHHRNETVDEAGTGLGVGVDGVGIRAA